MYATRILTFCANCFFLLLVLLQQIFDPTQKKLMRCTTKQSAKCSAMKLTSKNAGTRWRHQHHKGAAPGVDNDAYWVLRRHPHKGPFINDVVLLLLLSPPPNIVWIRHHLKVVMSMSRDWNLSGLLRKSPGTFGTVATPSYVVKIPFKNATLNSKLKRNKVRFFSGLLWFSPETAVIQTTWVLFD